MPYIPSMAKATPYRVLVRDLPTHRQIAVPHEHVNEWLRGHPMREALVEPGRVAPEVDPDAGHGVADLELYADGNNVFAVGSFQGEVTVACSRCVNPVKLPIDEQLHVTFMPAGDMPADADDDAEGEDGPVVAEDDLDLFPYDGEVIDLEPLLREQFVLAVPFAPLCREDCAGLCPQCGIDRNTGTCGCEAPIDPRLAALKGLKLPS